jgi:hypothetical protein
MVNNGGSEIRFTPVFRSLLLLLVGADGWEQTRDFLNARLVRCLAHHGSKPGTILITALLMAHMQYLLLSRIWGYA